jgi:hypothetical protein
MGPKLRWATSLECCSTFIDFAFRLEFLHSRLHRDVGRSNAAECVKICILVFWVVAVYHLLLCAVCLVLWRSADSFMQSVRLIWGDLIETELIKLHRCILTR